MIFKEFSSNLKKKLNENNNTNVIFALDKFHFRQAIHHICLNKDLEDIVTSYIMNDKKAFFNELCDNLIISFSHRSDTIEKKKEYILLQNTKEKITSSKNYTLNKIINIDYDYYNRIANKFRISYGIDTKSDLNIYLNIHEKNFDNNSFKLENKSVIALSIPLSQKSVNITLDYKDINKTSEVIKGPEVIKNNYLYIILGSGLIVIGIVELIHLINLLLLIKNKKTKYDKFINKILNEYDRLIVETTTAPNKQDKI